jgi:hypothetical protein
VRVEIANRLARPTRSNGATVSYCGKNARSFRTKFAVVSMLIKAVNWYTGGFAYKESWIDCREYMHNAHNFSQISINLKSLTSLPYRETNARFGGVRTIRCETKTEGGHVAQKVLELWIKDTQPNKRKTNAGGYSYPLLQGSEHHLQTTHIVSGPVSRYLQGYIQWVYGGVRPPVPLV